MVGPLRRLRDDPRRVVSRAGRKLAKAGDVEGLLHLAVNDPSERADALMALLDVAQERPADVRASRGSILSMVRPWLADPDPAVRAQALGFTTLLRDDRAGSAATAALSDLDARVRLQALIGVFHLAPAGCLGEVLRLLSDPDPNVRSFAAAALERVGDEAARDALAEAVEREPDPVVRERMAEVLEILDGRRPPTPIEPFMGEV